MNKKRILLITGMSGAGKTSVMGILEDMGYHCIDQFPIKLINDLAQMLGQESDPRYDFVALATNLSDFGEFQRKFDAMDMDVQVLILDCNEDELLRRYKYTRRTHPMLISNKATTLEDAIYLEGELLKDLKDTAYLTIDTTFLKSNELKAKINQYFALTNQPSFSISFISFGYKNGVPMDADLLFDVRFLPNPYWVEELRPFSGNDKNVYEYVMQAPQTQTLLTKLTDFLDYAFKEYVKEGKNHFTVSVGCTGGQHRSVVIINWLFEHYGKDYHVYKEHRDLGG
jgi:UPF0042 nucleotide-binding protein